MACHRKAFSLQTHRTRIRSCGLVRNLQFVPDGRLYEKRLGTTPFLQSQHVMIVEISIHNRKPSGQDVAQREHDVAMRMAFSREANQRSIGRSFFDELRLRHHFVENMRILSINRGCRGKKYIAVGARKGVSFGNTADSVAKRTLELHGHATMSHTLRSLPVTTTARQAIAI